MFVFQVNPKVNIIIFFYVNRSRAIVGGGQCEFLNNSYQLYNLSKKGRKPLKPIQWVLYIPASEWRVSYNKFMYFYFQLGWRGLWSWNWCAHGQTNIRYVPGKLNVRRYLSAWKWQTKRARVHVILFKRKKNKTKTTKNIVNKNTKNKLIMMFV